MYIGTSINESPVIAGIAAAKIEAGGMKAVAISADGVAVATAGAVAAGLLLAETDDPIQPGDTVTIQVKDIGLWQTGEAVAPGDLLASDANGKAVKAAAGAFIVAQALEAATAADQVVHVQIIKAGYAA
jgi:hypothetical protein